MSPTTMKKAISMNRPLLSLLTLGASLALCAAAQAAAPGITGPTFNLDANTGNLNQPDGNEPANPNEPRLRPCRSKGRSDAQLALGQGQIFWHQST